MATRGHWRGQEGKATTPSTEEKRRRPAAGGDEQKAGDSEREASGDEREADDNNKPAGRREMMKVRGKEGKAVQFLRLHLLMSRRDDGKCR